MLYWVSYYEEGTWHIVLETESENEAINKKEELEAKGYTVIMDYDN